MDMAIPWFALQTKPRNEKQVERLLTHKGYECCLPMYRQKRRWSDRVIDLELPLFPMYIFCRFNSHAMGKAIATPGVTRIVGFGGRPAEVNVEEVEALQLLSQSRCLREPWAYIPNGTLVKVETGPLAGAQGIFCSSEDRRRLVISVAILQRSVAVQLDENTLISLVEDIKEGREGIFGNQLDLPLRLIRKARQHE
jgi:transcription antitermination factor NusG